MNTENPTITKPRFNPSWLDEEKTEEKHEKGWGVILWNDPINSMEFIIIAIIKIMNFNLDKAQFHMLEAHLKGKSILTITNKEQATLYCEQFESMGISASIEKQ